MRKGWKLKKLGQIGDCSIGLTYKPENVTETDGTLVLRSSNIRNGRIVYGDDVFVSSHVPDSARVRKGDILICVRNGSRDLIGKCALVDGAADGHAFGAFMAVFRSRNNDFIYQLFQTGEYRKQVQRNLGATINQITNKNIRDFKFLFPAPTQQQVIVEVLGVWDDAIEKLDALIAAKERYIRGMLSACVNDARKASKRGDWQKTTLGEVTKLVSRRVIWDEQATYRRITVKRGCGGLVFRGDRKGHEILTKDMYTVRSGDFVISKRQVVHGAWAMATPEFDRAHVSKEYACLRAKPDRLWMPYFDWLTRTERLQHEAFICSYGVDIEKMVLNVEWLLRTPLLLPRSIETQKAMAAGLDCLQGEVRLLQAQMQALRRQKSGLMQKLLRGEWSVPGDGDVEKTTERAALAAAQ
jgi:type I restriction enzyme S subunit